jgi:acetate kinase
MDFMGILLDATANASNASVISAKDSRTTVRVIKTNEDLIIARHACRLITNNLLKE